MDAWSVVDAAGAAAAIAADAATAAMNVHLDKKFLFSPFPKRKLYFWWVLGFELVLLVGSEISKYFWWGLCAFGGVLFLATYFWWGRKNYCT